MPTELLDEVEIILVQLVMNLVQQLEERDVAVGLMLL